MSESITSDSSLASMIEMDIPTRVIDWVGGQQMEGDPATRLLKFKAKVLFLPSLLIGGHLDETTTDVMFICENRIEVKAHRVVLSLASRYFTSIFHDQDPAELTVVNIPDIPADILRMIISLLYGKDNFVKPTGIAVVPLMEWLERFGLANTLFDIDQIPVDVTQTDPSPQRPGQVTTSRNTANLEPPGQGDSAVLGDIHNRQAVMETVVRQVAGGTGDNGNNRANATVNQLPQGSPPSASGTLAKSDMPGTSRQAMQQQVGSGGAQCLPANSQVSPQSTTGSTTAPLRSADANNVAASSSAPLSPLTNGINSAGPTTAPRVLSNGENTLGSSSPQSSTTRDVGASPSSSTAPTQGPSTSGGNPGEGLNGSAIFPAPPHIFKRPSVFGTNSGPSTSKRVRLTSTNPQAQSSSSGQPPQQQQQHPPTPFQAHRNRTHSLDREGRGRSRSRLGARARASSADSVSIAGDYSGKRFKKLLGSNPKSARLQNKLSKMRGRTRSGCYGERSGSNNR